MRRAGLAALLGLLALAGEVSAQSPAPLGAGEPLIRAQIVSKRYTTLSAGVAGEVDRILVREGESFREGDRLVALDCNVLQAQADRARAQVTVAERIHKANSRLLEMNSIGVVEVENSASEVAKARAEAKTMEFTVAKCVVTAPFPGKVFEQKVREKQYVQIGQPMLDILDDKSLEVEFVAPSTLLGGLRVGTDLTMDVDETATRHTVRITRTGAKVDPVSQSIKITGDLVGEIGGLIPGMSGRIRVAPIGMVAR
jgi:RND family efflux transporter MFP subunit